MNNTLLQLKELLNKKGIEDKEILPLLNSIQKELKTKKYGLVWEDREETVLEELQKKIPLLTEYKEIKTNNKPTNLLLEGDNLHSLRSLQFTHKEKISLIYIDPPYNTGNKDFKYNDKFIDKEDSWRHSKWLSFMSKRLKLAKELLSSKGLIFISIDENEYAQLKLLCDEIFGEDNLTSSIIWQCKYTVSNDKKGVTSQTEHILVYSKSNTPFEFKNNPLREEYVSKTYKNPDNDYRGAWRTVQLYKKKNPKAYTVKSPTTNKEWTMPWNYNEEGFKKLMREDKVFWGKDGNACPTKKVFLSESKGVSQKNLWLGEEVGYSGDGGNLLENILGDRNKFSYPKPLKLMKKIVDIIDDKNLIALDFFAGSGTFGQAILELNNEDNGNRQFILCTNNENNICEEVTYERLKRVINGYTNKKGVEILGTKGNLKYCKITLKEDLDDIDSSVDNIINETTPLLMLKENCFDLLESNDIYDLISNESKKKIVLVYKNVLAVDYEVVQIAKILDNYNYKSKIIYSTNVTSLNNLNIQVKEFPKNLIELQQKSI